MPRLMTSPNYFFGVRLFQEADLEQSHPAAASHANALEGIQAGGSTIGTQKDSLMDRDCHLQGVGEGRVIIIIIVFLGKCSILDLLCLCHSEEAPSSHVSMEMWHGYVLLTYGVRDFS